MLGDANERAKIQKMLLEMNSPAHSNQNLK